MVDKVELVVVANASKVHLVRLVHRAEMAGQAPQEDLAILDHQDETELFCLLHHQNRHAKNAHRDRRDHPDRPDQRDFLDLKAMLVRQVRMVSLDALDRKGRLDLLVNLENRVIRDHRETPAKC